jgi:hypothetical protein
MMEIHWDTNQRLKTLIMMWIRKEKERIFTVSHTPNLEATFSTLIICWKYGKKK